VRVVDRVVAQEVTLRATPASVALARHHFATVAGGSNMPVSVRDAGELAVSELVTNAIVHGADPITLRVTAFDRMVRVAVSDGDPQPPRPGRRDAQLRAEHGRGLAIVASVCDRWGCDPAVLGPGKTVWCDLSYT
jgi:anti-sigma regulatory factor (Ser/Thr protein kinase)